MSTDHSDDRRGFDFDDIRAALELAEMRRRFQGSPILEAELAALKAECGRYRKVVRWLAVEQPFDGIYGLDLDVHEIACEVYIERTGDEDDIDPTTEDYMEAYVRLIEAACPESVQSTASVPDEDREDA